MYQLCLHLVGNLPGAGPSHTVVDVVYVLVEDPEVITTEVTYKTHQWGCSIAGEFSHGPFTYSTCDWVKANF